MKNNFKLTVKLFIIIIFIIICLFFFLNLLKKQLKTYNISYLEHTSAQFSDQIGNELIDAMNIIKNISLVLETKDEEGRIQFKNKIVYNSPFDYLDIVDSQGMIYDPVKQRLVDVSRRSYFQEGMKGRSGVEMLFDSKLNKKKALLFYTPIKEENRVTSVLVGVYEEFRIKKVILDSVFNNHVKLCLFDHQGQVIAHTFPKSLYNVFSDTKFKLKNKALDLRPYLEEKQLRVFSDLDDRNMRILALMPIKHFDYYVLVGFSDNIVDKLQEMTLYSGIIVFIALCILFSSLILLLFNYFKEFKRERALLKQESETWKELLRLALKNTSLFEFYYYPKEDRVVIPERTSRYYECDSVYDNMPESFAEAFVAAEDRAVYCAMYEKIKRGESAAEAVFRNKYYTRWCKVNLTVITYDHEGNPEYAVGAVEDITEQVNRERSLQLSEIVQKLNNEYFGIYYFDLTDHTYEMVRCNETIAEKIGLKSKKDFRQVIASYVSVFVHPDDKEDITSFLKESGMVKALLLNNGDVSKIYRRIKSDTDYEWMEFRLIAGKKENNSIKTVLLAIRSINRQICQEKENRLLLENALQQAKTASIAKSEFLSRMSHEIRTPLNGIMGMTEIALRSTDDQKKLTDCLHKVIGSSQHLLLLLNDILDMAKIESGKLEIKNEKFNLKLLLKSLEDLFISQAKAKLIDYQVIAENGLPELLLGDALRLKQILVNLLSNALKFTPEKGSVTLAVCKYKIYNRKIFLRFTVKDTGCGIAKEDCERIFDSFEQAKAGSKQGGTGLGLTITKRFVGMMGGTIMVDSEPGRGSVFTVELPFSHPGEGNQEELSCKEPFIPENAFTGKRIMIVEDSPINLEIALELLKITGAELSTALDGEEAVEKFKASSEHYYDLILMDLQMPNLNGYQATEMIRSLKRTDSQTVPIVAMTANAFDEDVVRCLASGMNDHISKPLDLPVFYSVIRKYL